MDNTHGEVMMTYRRTEEENEGIARKKLGSLYDDKDWQRFAMARQLWPEENLAVESNHAKDCRLYLTNCMPRVAAIV